jgi:hypothetical protein
MVSPIQNIAQNPIDLRSIPPEVKTAFKEIGISEADLSKLDTDQDHVIRGEELAALASMIEARTQGRTTGGDVAVTFGALDAELRRVRDAGPPPSGPSADPLDAASGARPSAGMRAVVRGGPAAGTSGTAGASGASGASGAAAASGLTPAEKWSRQARLDAFMASMTSSYRIPGGDPVEVPSAFRINGGINQDQPETSKKKMRDALGADATNGMNLRINRVAYGRGTPNDIRMVTQALIDHGKLPEKAEGMSDAARVRKMMWDYGVGTDCSGYVSQAAPAARGKTPAQMGTDKVVSELGGLYPPANHWESLKPAADALLTAETGDIVKLDDPENDFGHFVVVYDNAILDDEAAKKLAAANSGDDDATKFFAGKVRALTVDSSWGAGGDWTATSGGVKRNTWLYSQATKQWATLDSAGKISITPEGPYAHKLNAVFRGK